MLCYKPLMRDALEKNGGKLSQAQAMEVMEKCLKVLFYRDARSVNKVPQCACSVQMV